jgi:hypothetical protein
VYARGQPTVDAASGLEEPRAPWDEVSVDARTQCASAHLRHGRIGVECRAGARQSEPVPPAGPQRHAARDRRAVCKGGLMGGPHATARQAQERTRRATRHLGVRARRMPSPPTRATLATDTRERSARVIVVPHLIHLAVWARALATPRSHAGCGSLHDLGDRLRGRRVEHEVEQLVLACGLGRAQEIIGVGGRTKG